MATAPPHRQLLRLQVTQVMAEAAERAAGAEPLEEVEADALLLAVHADDEVHVVRELAGHPPAALVLCEVEADLPLGLWHAGLLLPRRRGCCCGRRLQRLLAVGRLLLVRSSRRAGACSMAQGQWMRWHPARTVRQDSRQGSHLPLRLRHLLH